MKDPKEHKVVAKISGFGFDGESLEVTIEGLADEGEVLKLLVDLRSLLGNPPSYPMVPVKEEPTPPARTRKTTPPASAAPVQPAQQAPAVTQAQPVTPAAAPAPAAQAVPAEQKPAQADAGAVETRVTPPRQETPTQAVTPATTAAPVQAAAPAVANGVTELVPAEQAPADLAAAKSFREVIVWMFAKGFVTHEQILERCNAYMQSVPLLKDLGMAKPGQPTLADRLERALKVMKPTIHAPAAM